MKDLETITELVEFLNGTQPVAFQVLANKDDIYSWTQNVLKKFKFLSISKKDRGIVRKYIMKIIGYSPSQVTRLIKRYKKTGNIVRKRSRLNAFKYKYTKEDVVLLSQLDELHGTLSGTATKKLCERALLLFSEKAYQRLSGISVAHIYNLRSSKKYKQQRLIVEKTKPKKSSIGERRKPRSNGKPGFIRIDTVHQGDYDKEKGVYHINATDEVTQFEVVCTVEKISEQYLIPALKLLLAQFPFKILGFHSDNGSEYINKTVAALLQKLLIEFTKSRPYHSNDNGLAETKNGHVVRKVFGHGYIPQYWAPKINEFNQQYLNPYVNYHRPCFFPKIITDDRGKEKRIYKYEDMTTPFEKLKSIENVSQYLKSGVTIRELNETAFKMTDNQAAKALKQARQELFSEIFKHEQAGCV